MHRLLQILLGCITRSTPILVNVFRSLALVGFKLLDFGTVHEFDDVVRLPLFETEAEAFVAVVFVVCLILVVLDLRCQWYSGI